MDIDKKYIENSIAQWINDYETENNISILDIKKNQYNYILMQIYDNVIKRIYLLISDKSIIDIPDIVIEYITDLYIQLSFKYNKSITISGYSYILGINYSTIVMNCTDTCNKEYIYADINTHKSVNISSVFEYSENDKKQILIRVSNSIIRECYKTVIQTAEHNLAEMSIDNNIGALAIGKIKYGWMEGKKAQLETALLEKTVPASALLEDYKRLYAEKQIESSNQ